MLIEYLSIYIIFSLLGWVFEYIAFDKMQYDRLLYMLFGIKLPMLSLYGFMACGLYFINEFNISLIYKVIIAIIFVNLFECIAGLISERILGEQTWKYDGGICKGYISFSTAIFWGIMSTLFFLVMQGMSN